MCITEYAQAMEYFIQKWRRCNFTKTRITSNQTEKLLEYAGKNIGIYIHTCTSNDKRHPKFYTCTYIYSYTPGVGCSKTSQICNICDVLAMAQGQICVLLARVVQNVCKHSVNYRYCSDNAPMTQTAELTVYEEFVV